MSVKISVIIPVYNDEKYLQECLDSVMNQTFKDFECICVDDCSIDKSAEIIESYRQKDSRIKYIKHEKNKGVSNSRYTGLLNAKAEWIAFIDHDDIVSKKYLEYLYNKIDDENEIDVVCCRNDFLSDDFSFDQTQIGNETIYSCGKEILNRKFTENYTMLSIWAKLFRKEILLNLEINKYRNKYTRSWFEDIYVSNFYFFECRKIIFIDNVLYGYRFNENSLSHTMTDVEYYVNRPGCDYVLTNKYFQMNMYEKGLENYEGMLLSYMKAAYILYGKTKYQETYRGLISDYNKTFDERKYLHSKMNIYTRINTKIFRLSPLLWQKTIGFIYFDIASKFPQLYKKLGSLR